MYKAVLLPEAKSDVYDAASWYNFKTKGLGKRFTSQVRKSVKGLCAQPEMAAVKYDNTRCAVLDGFPYMIHFVIDKDSKTLIVIAVFHTSRSPEEWRERVSP